MTQQIWQVLTTYHYLPLTKAVSVSLQLHRCHHKTMTTVNLFLSTVHMLGVNRTNDLNTGLGKVIKLWYHRSDMECWRRKSKITKGKYVRMNLHLSDDMISHGTRALKLIQRSLYEGQYYKWTACQTESLNLHNRTVTCSLYHTPLVFYWKVWTLLHFQNQNSRVNLCERLRLDRHSSTTWLQACKAWAKLSYLHKRFLLSFHFSSIFGFGRKVTDVTQFLCLCGVHCLSWDQIVLYRTDRPAINIRDKSKLFCKANHILDNHLTDVWMRVHIMTTEKDKDNTQVDLLGSS